MNDLFLYAYNPMPIIPKVLKSYLEAMFPGEEYRILNIKGYTFGTCYNKADDTHYYVSVGGHFLDIVILQQMVRVDLCVHRCSVAGLTFYENAPHYI